MKSPLPTQDRLPLAFAFFLVLFGAFFRVFRLELLPGLPNFAPLMALAFCGALFLPGALAFVVPFGALLLSDLLLNLHYGVSLLSSGELVRYACYGIAVACGLAARRTHASPLPVLGLVTANSLLFYLVTNTAAWIGNTSYPQTFAGLLQSLTVGLPGFPPTWTFFRNSLASDLVFAAVFLAALHLASRKSEAPVPVRI